MTEDLYAFCERCGKAAASPLAKTPTAPKGLRRLLPSARQTKVDAPVSALRLCLGCRGYVCDECWNEPATVCQTCQPLDHAASLAPMVLDQYAPSPNGLAFAGETEWADIDDTARLSATTSWPESDLRRPLASVEPPLEPVVADAEPLEAEMDLADAHAEIEAEAEVEAEAEELEAEANEVVAEAEADEVVAEAEEFEAEAEEFEAEAEADEVVAEADTAVAAAEEPEAAAVEEEVDEPYLVLSATEDVAATAEAASSVAHDDLEDFEARMAELMNRVQAVGVTDGEDDAEGDEPDEAAPMSEPSAVDDPAYVEERWRAQAVLSEMLEGVQDMREDVVAETDAAAEPTVVEAPDYEPVLESPLVAEPESVAETEWVAEANETAEDEYVDEADLVASPAEMVDDEFVADGFVTEVAAAEVMADETLAADETVAGDETVAADESVVEHDGDGEFERYLAAVGAASAAAFVGEEPPLAANEAHAVAQDPADDAAVPAVETEPVVAAEFETTADSLPAEAVEAPVADTAAGQDAVEKPAPATADHDEDLWAAVLASQTDEADAEDAFEPNRSELEQALRPRLEPESTPTTEPETMPAPPPAAPSRIPHLPIAMPPRPPASTTPWPMPTPPAFLPPPPPAMLSVVQPAPARFRPQVAVAPEPVALPSTRPCGSCGLELSAKVAFCRRCGTRQLSA